MILTVTLNAALDVTYRLDHVAWGEVNRVASVARRAGGKGVNVARILNALGVEVVVTGLAGGATGAAIRTDLAASGIADHLVEVGNESRRTVVVAEHEGATLFNEPGPAIAPAEWRCFLTRFGSLLPGARAVVLSGSLPGGLPADTYAILVRTAREAGVPTILDADGDALRRGVAGRPWIVKPNAAELATFAGTRLPLVGRAEAGAAAQSLRDAGAEAVVATLGADGLLASTPQGAWVVAPPERVSGNPTGAGDAVAAALARGLAEGCPWPVILADAAALSAASVSTALAGDFDRDAYERYRTTARVEPL